MNIEGLDETAIVMNYTPLKLNPFGEWDTPPCPFETLTLSYLFPLRYLRGAVELQEGCALSIAVATTRSCQAFDGGGLIWPVVRPIRGGKKAKLCPWGNPNVPTDGQALQIPRGDVVEQCSREIEDMSHTRRK